MESALKSISVNPKIALSEPASLLTFEAEKWLEKQGLRSGENYEVTRIRSAENVGGAVIRGDAGAGILSLNSFLSHSAAIRDQLVIAHLIAEIPAFYIMTSEKLSQSMTANLRNSFDAFSGASIEGKEFETRSSFTIAKVTGNGDLAKMDSYLEKTKKILT